MASRLDSTFAALRAKREGALVCFVTAGDPTVEGTAELVVALAEAGADIVELGIPYSDPLADGPTVQNASQRALDRGVTPSTVFQVVADVRRASGVPLVLMTSYNLALRSGLARFARDAAGAGADGVILTDLPPEEAAAWKSEADAAGLATIFLVTPLSTPARIQSITAMTTGFVYCVSRTGVTGARVELPADITETVARVRAATDKPVCVGFGIATPEHVRQVVAVADGAVIGSALVDFLHRSRDTPDWQTQMRHLVQQWKEGARRQHADVF